MSRIIVFGASGQLGQCLQVVAKEREIKDVDFLPEENANILDVPALTLLFEEHRPSYCINCAAYTAVDKAEDEEDLAFKINSEGAHNLATLCATYGTALIHISTDFVFSGAHFIPLTEEDIPAPISVYGKTKLEGEIAIAAATSQFFILRTSWLYSEFANNFVKTMLKLGREKEELRVIWDQVGTPTYAIDLAGCIFTIIQNGYTDFGIYHYSNEGVASWYDFAKAIFEIGGVVVKVVPVRTAAYVTKAKRPAYSVMDKAKVKEKLGIQIPHWRESLTNCINKL